MNKEAKQNINTAVHGLTHSSTIQLVTNERQLPQTDLDVKHSIGITSIKSVKNGHSNGYSRNRKWLIYVILRYVS